MSDYCALDSISISALENEIIVGVGFKEDVLILKTKFGKIFHMLHLRECCEDVYLEDGLEDLKNLIGEEILQAYETTNRGLNDEGTYTYTFYTLSTFYSSATLRWYGSSNGYYSEEVYLFLIKGS